MASARHVCGWCRRAAPLHARGCNRYFPHEQQYRAHMAPEPVRLIGGGWASGKTRALVQEAHDHASKETGTPFLMTSPTWKMMRRTIWRSIVESWPGATRWPTGRDKAREVLGPLVSDWSASTGVLRFWNGEELFFGSLQVPESIEGVNAGAGGMDEPRLVTKEAFLLQLSRIGRSKRATNRFLISGVPTMGWMSATFGPGRAIDRTNNAGPRQGDFAFIRCKTEWNPHLQAGYAERMRSRMSERRARAFMDGEFVHFAGVVYETYDPIPYRDGDTGSVLGIEPAPDRYTFGGLDFGYRRPAFILLQRIDHKLYGPIDVVVLQVVASEIDEEVHARMIATELQRRGLTMDICWCDSQGKVGAVPERHAPNLLPAVETYKRVFRQSGVLKAEGLSWHGTPICRLKTNRIEVVRQRFRGWDGKRRLFVARALVEYDEGRVGDSSGATKSIPGLHASLTNYKYLHTEGRENPDKKAGFSDFCDALEFAMVGEYGVFGAKGPDDKAPDYQQMGEALNEELFPVGGGEDLNDGFGRWD